MARSEHESSMKLDSGVWFIRWQCRVLKAGVLADLDPPRIGPPGPNPLADPYPLADFDPPPRIWTP